MIKDLTLTANQPAPPNRLISIDYFSKTDLSVLSNILTSGNHSSRFSDSFVHALFKRFSSGCLIDLKEHITLRKERKIESRLEKRFVYHSLGSSLKLHIISLRSELNIEFK